MSGVHQATLQTLSNLALSLERLDDYAQAAALLETLYTGRCRLLGETHPDTLRTLYDWATALFYQGELHRADGLFERLYQQRCQILGEVHPDTLQVLSVRALILRQLGDQKKQAEVLEELYSKYCETLGETHSDTMQIRLLLAAALSFAVCENAIPSLILGAVCGILADISAGGTVGYFAIAFTIVCFVISGLLGTYLNRNFLSGAVLSLGAVVLIMGLYFVFFRLFAGVPESGTLFVSRFLPRMAYTFLTFIPLYFLNRFLSNSFI